MQQQRSSYAKCVLLTVMLVAVSMSGMARPRTTYKKSSGVQHYITLSAGGGEGNTMMSSLDNYEIVRNQIGADGQLHIGYELRQKRFIFGLGAGADYDYSRQRIDSFKLFYPRHDRENDAIIYTYAFRDYRDKQQSVRLSIPIYVGGYVADNVYLLGGVKLGIQLWNTHTAETELETYGTYTDFIHTIHKVPYYGYYAEDHYRYTSAYPAASLRLTPMVEAGYRIPLQTKSKRVEMRVGAYAEYGIPLGTTNELTMADISRTDINPATQNQEDLRAKLILNSPVSTDWQKGGKSCNLQVGVRFTCLFNVTPPKRFCMCQK